MEFVNGKDDTFVTLLLLCPLALGLMQRYKQPVQGRALSHNAVVVWLDHPFVLENLLFEAGELHGEVMVQKLVVEGFFHIAAHCSTQSLV
jgi:nitrate reductase gamma subunit